MRIFGFVFFMVMSLYGYQVQKLKEMPRIYVIDEFLSQDECDYIIEKARPHLKRSTVVSDKNTVEGEIDPRRSSQGMFFPQNPQDPVLQRVEKRIAELTGIPFQNGEAIQVLCYKTGAEYQPHYDYFNPGTPGGAANLLRGGQRIATLIMYLNTPEEGGETIFPRVKASVTPQKGSAVLFYSTLPNGTVDPLSLHGGAPVKAGEKWIATKWLHEREFH